MPAEGGGDAVPQALPQREQGGRRRPRLAQHLERAHRHPRQRRAASDPRRHERHGVRRRPRHLDVDASPNGELLAYSAIVPAGQQIITIDKNGQQVDSYNPGYHPAWVRFTPDGNGLLVPGCADDRDGNNTAA